ncbi:putative FMN-binding regulatory protein PaiB [Bradyrhizobium sp. LM2.7]
MGTIFAHVARANPQWKLTPTGEAMAIFAGAEAYVSPSWYVTKHERGEVVPTWNYVAVHAYGPVEFFDDADRLRKVVTRLTDVHERSAKTVGRCLTPLPISSKRSLRGLSVCDCKLHGSMARGR